MNKTKRIIKDAGGAPYPKEEVQTAVKDAPALDISAPQQIYPAYVESPTVTAAKNALAAQMAKKPTYTSRYRTQLEEILGKIEKREPFSYDINGDALYEQYKDQYIRNGKLATEDVMGQAQAMTGGYGNSFAQTAGNEAYLSYIAQLNSMIPELEERAYGRYQDEGAALLEQYALLAEQEGIDYDRYRNELSLYLDERDYLTGRLDAEKSFDYSKYLDGYGAYRDSVSDQKWQAEYDEALRRYEDSQTGNMTANDDPATGGDETGGIPNEIIAQLESATGNYELSDVIDRLQERGELTEIEADALYKQYKQADFEDREWTLIDDGGVNGFGGIDNNAVVRDQYGNQYRLDKLVKALISEGMDKADAKKFVKDLQTRLGA